MASFIDPERNTVSLSSDISETVIGARTSFVGNVTTDTPVRIEGIYEGEIHGNCAVEIAESGSFKGTAECETLKLSGKADGNLNCAKLFEMVPGCEFTGEVTTKDVIIKEGCVFGGKLNIVK